ncbi:hypothetical protein MAM1_0451c10574 [Mucor ambiguus]|uniref:SRP9 domain-containing protein n=1 Tax=Mucor ambiguus TaxID=91626 RepID=A0A0C9N4L2_9FUNG|nr:hypothetical protein MAM1_0451c10574 [Mucor ambiguus]
MYITNWDEFQKAAEDLYIASPEQTRYVHTFDRSDGDLVLKITDDRTRINVEDDEQGKEWYGDRMLEQDGSIDSNLIDEDTVIPDAAPLVAAKNAVPEVKTASPKQTPKGKKSGKKRR